ncbi:MAG: diguanylate cyclase [Deltaproteobacteria bacterium]|nr:diguanylate cyclase [Deltaproteobacteria bacterium]
MALERWGIKTIDGALKGLEEGRKYFVHGDSQFDLLAMVVTFLATGLRFKQRVALLTSEPPGNIEQVARFLGTEIERDIRKDQFVILHCKPFFGEKLVQLGGARRLTQEMRFLLGSPLPQRIGVFPIASLLSQSTPEQLMQSTRMVCEALETIPATVMAAEVGKTAGGEELYVVAEMRRRFDGTFRAGTGPDGTRQLALEKDWVERERGLRWVYFMQRSQGIQAVESEEEEKRAAPASAAEARSLLLVSDDEAEVTRLKQEMEPLFSLAVARGETEAMTHVLGPSCSLVLVSLQNFERGMAFCRYMRSQRLHLPIVLVGSQRRRAAERAAILLQGVDDFVVRPYSTIELMSRVSSILRRTSLGFPLEEIAEYIGVQKRLYQRLKRLRKLDPDTGLATYQFFVSALEHELFKAKMAGYPCSLVALKAGGGDEAFEATRDLLKQQLRSEDLVTLLPNETFLLFLGQGGAEEARQFVARLGEVARITIREYVTHLKYGVASYPRDGSDAESLIQVTTSKLQDESENGKL